MRYCFENVHRLVHAQAAQAVRQWVIIPTREQIEEKLYAKIHNRIRPDRVLYQNTWAETTHAFDNSNFFRQLYDILDVELKKPKPKRKYRPRKKALTWDI